MRWCAAGVLLATSADIGTYVAPALGAEPTLRVPSCAQFVDFGARWVGIDEAAAARVLGVPLYALTDGDIDRIARSLQICLAAADTKQAAALLKEDVAHMPSLRAARDRVLRAFTEFAAAKKVAEPKLLRLAARIDALPTTPRARGALDDAEATVSAVFAKRQ